MWVVFRVPLAPESGWDRTGQARSGLGHARPGQGKPGWDRLGRSRSERAGRDRPGQDGTGQVMYIQGRRGRGRPGRRGAGQDGAGTGQAGAGRVRRPAAAATEKAGRESGLRRPPVERERGLTPGGRRTTSDPACDIPAVTASDTDPSPSRHCRAPEM